MIVLLGAVLGALFGARKAKLRRGNRLDIAQYATVGAIVGALIGLFVTIGVERIL